MFGGKQLYLCVNINNVDEPILYSHIRIPLDKINENLDVCEFRDSVIRDYLNPKKNIG